MLLWIILAFGSIGTFVLLWACCAAAAEADRASEETLRLLRESDANPRRRETH